MSEEAQVPYIFVSSKEELGQASSTKRPTSCVMICPQQKRKIRKKEDEDGEAGKETEDWKELYEECYREVEKMDMRVVF
jgi:H/ACA ribonucleoprotein complex subunit 2